MSMGFFSARVFKLTKLIDIEWEKSFHCWIHKISHYGRCWHLLEIKGHHPSRSFSCHWLLWCTFFSWQNVKMIFIYNFFLSKWGKMRSYPYTTVENIIKVVSPSWDKGTSPITSRSMTPLIHLLWWSLAVKRSFKLYVLLCAFKPNKIWIFKTLSQFFISTIINNKNMWKPNLITIENCWTSKQCGTI